MTYHDLVRRTLALYRTSPLTERIFVQIRAALSDLPFVERHAPRSGTMLDIGCGHGLLTNMLALGSPDRDVLGIDIDPAKVAAAQRTVQGRANIHFEVTDGNIDSIGPFRAITVADVFYLLPEDAQRRLIGDCYQLLEPGGLFLWKSQVRSPRWKYAITYGQEWLMTRLGPTAGQVLCFLDSETSRSALREAGFVASELPMRSWRPYTDVLFIGVKPESPPVDPAR